MERPALTRLPKAVQAGEIEGVVVYKLDRLSRRVVDCVKLVREEWYGRCSLFSTAERFDTELPVGKMIFNILISFAEFERDVIRDRAQSGKKKRASQGRNAGHKYIYGYRLQLVKAIDAHVDAGMSRSCQQHVTDLTPTLPQRHRNRVPSCDRDEAPISSICRALRRIL